MDYELYRLNTWLRQCAVPAEVHIAHSPTPPSIDQPGAASMRQHWHSLGADSVLHPCAESLTAQGCQAIVWACTSGSFAGGYEWARRQAKRIRAICDVPITSTTLAFVEAVNALDVSEVDVLSTYLDPATRQFAMTLAEAGVSVQETRSVVLDANDAAAVSANHLTTEQLAKNVKALGRSKRPVLIPNTSVNTLEIIETLEAETDRAVITANQVSIWHALRLLRCSVAVGSAGRLFKLSAFQSTPSTLAH